MNEGAGGPQTPAQASGHPNFVTDVPVQGPTDEGLRAADCYHAQNVLPAHPACVDCGGGLIPMWAQTKGFLGESISFGGVSARGFSGLGTTIAEEDLNKDVWTKLTPEQQTWVMNTLVKLNDLVTRQTYSKCPTFGPSITAAGGCFQIWFNWANKNSPVKPLRTDGVWDAYTMDALLTTVAIHPKDFPTPFPGTFVHVIPKEKKLSTGAMVGWGLAGATALGGVVWAVTRKPRRRR